MKVLLQIDFVSEKEKRFVGSARLELDVPFTPSPDIGFIMSPWIDSRKPQSVVFEVELDKMLLVFENEWHESKPACQARMEEYRQNSWTVTDLRW